MSDNCGFRDGEIHMHMERCYQAGRADARTSPATSTLVTHVDLGAIWIERDGEQVRVDADEVTQLVHSLLIHRLALLDAR